uniref:Uncharacterized protein n=1 Tax=Anopheles maculatus TaxID=74869 RepID=A0A182T2L3_9DIPT
EGSIGHELVIKPVPTDISQEEDGSVHHVIYKRKTPEEHNDQFSDYAFMEPDRLQKRFRSKRSPQAYYKSSRAIDRTIYPEILVIVDYDGYRLHGGDNVQVKRYFVSFWNGVDLRYRLLKGPKIRISIAGIIISRLKALKVPLEAVVVSHLERLIYPSKALNSSPPALGQSAFCCALQLQLTGVHAISGTA